MSVTDQGSAEGTKPPAPTPASGGVGLVGMLNEVLYGKPEEPKGIDC